MWLGCQVVADQQYSVGPNPLGFQFAGSSLAVVAGGHQFAG